MARPRKYPEKPGAQQPQEPTGKRGDTYIATLENDGTICKVGDRIFIRVPSDDDVKVEYPDNMFGKMGIPKNKKAVDLMKAINNAMKACCQRYTIYERMKEVIAKHIDTLSDVEYNSDRRKEVPQEDNAELLEIVAPYRKAGGYSDGNISFILNLFWGMTFIKPKGLPVTDDIFDSMHEVE